jgi:hypothetical protein
MRYMRTLGESSMPRPDNRSEGRSNVFLTASLDTGAARIAVRIRNLASRGALVESSSLPPVGTRVKLIRGELIATGDLAWDGAGQGGINFCDPIDVERWVKRVGHVGQQRVDRAVAALRGHGETPADWDGSKSFDNLGAISAALDSLCERLSGTPDMSVELGEDLVKLDTIAQALRRIATESGS